MSAEDVRAQGIEARIAEAQKLNGEERYAEGRRVAGEARDGARQIESLRLEVKASAVEAAALHMLGDGAAALARYSWILDLAQDPVQKVEIARAGVEREVADAHIRWVEAARFLPRIPAERLLAMLDAGEAYVRAIGKPTWRAGLLQERADVLASQAHHDLALEAAKEALALKQQEPSSPGTSLGSHRMALADLLRNMKRYDEAKAQYEIIVSEAGFGRDRKAALQGLARCALGAGDPRAARKYAEDALQLAEGLGDNALFNALGALLNACLALNDVPAARAASDRQLASVREKDNLHRLYFALRDAAKVALAEKDATRARNLLAEARPHAEAHDRSHGRTTLQDEVTLYTAQANKLAASLN